MVTLWEVGVRLEGVAAVFIYLEIVFCLRKRSKIWINLVLF